METEPFLALKGEGFRKLVDLNSTSWFLLSPLCHSCEACPRPDRGAGIQNKNPKKTRGYPLPRV